MGIVKDVDFNIDKEIAVGNQTLRLKGTLTAPPGFNPMAFLGNIEAAANALSALDPQQKLPFGKVLSTDKFTVAADKPVKGRKSYEFTVKLDVSGEGGYEQASSIFALAQVLGTKPHVIEILEKPQPKKSVAPAKTEGGKPAAAGSKLPELSDLIPEKWYRQLEKAGIKAVASVLTYRNDAEKLSDHVKGLAVDDARAVIESVQSGMMKHYNETGIPLADVPGLTAHWIEKLKEVNLLTAEAVCSVGPEGLGKLKIPQLTRDQAQSIVTFCEKATEMATAVKEELPASI